MPRLPADFRIGSVEITDVVGPTRISPTEAVPTKFKATFTLERPALEVELFVMMSIPGNRPVVTELRLRAKTDRPGQGLPITTSVLRQVLVGPLLRSAMEAATTTVTPVPEGGPRAFRWAVDGRVYVTPEPQPLAGPGRDIAPARVDAAARIYTEATMAGSRAPGMAVAEALNVSRAQAARYIRQARERGLLAPRLSNTSEGGD